MDFRRLWLDGEFKKNLIHLGIAIIVVIIAIILLNINWGGTVQDLVDDVGPKIVRVTTNNEDGTYTIGQKLEIVCEFNEEIYMSSEGTPRLSLELDNGEIRYANYVDNGSKTEMTFEYVIRKGDKCSHLNYTEEDALDARGVTIKDKSGNVSSLILPLVGSDNSLSGNRNISIETEDPYAIIVEYQKSNELKEYTIIFNKKVNGFDESDIDVYNGMKYNFRTVEENRIYKIDVTKTTTVDQTITVKGGVCTDLQNNIPNTYSVPIPKGFYYCGGTKDNGVVISDNANDQNLEFYNSGIISESVTDSNNGNNFVWCPIDYVSDLNGTYTIKGNTESTSDILKGRFGRRDFGKYGYGSFSDYSENVTQALVTSLEKYLGFYVGRYEGIMGNDGRMGCKKSVRNSNGYVGRIDAKDNKSTLVLYNYLAANNAASYINKTYSAQSSVVSHMPYGAEWDTVMMWLDASGYDVTYDSSSWGNYVNSEIKNVKIINQADILNTGVTDYTMANHIYDLAGNLWEWTQETTSKQGNALRGGVYGSLGTETPAACRTAYGNTVNTFLCTSRPFLYVK